MEVAAMVDVAVENKILVSRGWVACKLLVKNINFVTAPAGIPPGH